MPYASIQVDKLTPHVGGEVRGVDLSQPLDESTFKQVHDALIDNGVIFFRLMLPFFIGLQIRWSGDLNEKRQYLQTHFGWKGNGVFGLAFRLQNDASAARGYTHPNVGQAVGWADGGK